jgi:hypothetical protein
MIALGLRGVMDGPAANHPTGHAVTRKLLDQEEFTLAKTKKAPAVAIDQRKQANRRGKSERRAANAQVAADRRIGQRREKVTRRRQIDPTTCERDYTDAEVEFMHALDLYKRTSGRMFPTCSEVLEVLRDLGYVKHECVAVACDAASETQTCFNQPC